MEQLNYNQLALAIESIVERVFDKQMSKCVSTLRQEVMAELGVSEYMALSKAIRVYSDNFIRKWRKAGRIKNVGTVKRVKFKVSDLELAASKDTHYQEYIAKKRRIAEKKLKTNTQLK